MLRIRPIKQLMAAPLFLEFIVLMPFFFLLSGPEEWERVHQAETCPWQFLWRRASHLHQLQQKRPILWVSLGSECVAGWICIAFEGRWQCFIFEELNLDPPDVCFLFFFSFLLRLDQIREQNWSLIIGLVVLFAVVYDKESSNGYQMAL